FQHFSSTTGLTNWNGGVGYNTVSYPSPVIIMRLQRLGATNWDFKMSGDGVNFTPLDGNSNFNVGTFTPTTAGFWISTFGATVGFGAAIEYVRFGNSAF